MQNKKTQECWMFHDRITNKHQDNDIDYDHCIFHHLEYLNSNKWTYIELSL